MPADISDQGEEASHSEADHDTPQQPEAPPRRVEAGPAIREAVEQIQRINRDLETLLLEMQKALETLEEAEVQKYADEREVESLRAALRQLNRTRENIPRQQQQGGRQDNRPRNPQREQRFQSSHRQRPSSRPQERNAESPRASESHEEHRSEQGPPPEEHRSDAPPEPEIPI